VDFVYELIHKRLINESFIKKHEIRDSYIRHATVVIRDKWLTFQWRLNDYY